MKIISAVRHSGKTYHSKSLGFADCDEIIANKIGWPLHLNKKEFLNRIYISPIIDEHQLMLSFSRDSWKVLEDYTNENDVVVSIPEVWSARSFWEWNVKPNVLVTIDEERHKQNLLEINQNHMWPTIKFWRLMLEHEAKENDIKVVNTFEDAVLYLNEN
tara:strand:+ start:1833 stop:2309 length:477 start_codon:yes stop_codon:yes gene_type:complete